MSFLVLYIFSSHLTFSPYSFFVSVFASLPDTLSDILDTSLGSRDSTGNSKQGWQLLATKIYLYAAWCFCLLALLLVCLSASTLLLIASHEICIRNWESRVTFRTVALVNVRKAPFLYVVECVITLVFRAHTFSTFTIQERTCYFRILTILYWRNTEMTNSIMILTL